jgi:hypothetical protein
MISYHEALSRCLDAVRHGGDLEGVIASLPARYAERLRNDAALIRAVRDLAATVPPPSADAERAAAARLRNELAGARSAARQPASGGGWFGGLRLPRYTLAAVTIAVLLIAGSFLLPASEVGDVEAAVFEGVVVASGGDNLTVQTLSALEEVSIPGNAEISDESGATLDPASLEVGQVVLVRGNREAGVVRAANVERRLNGLPGWCTDDAPRCRQLAENLESARERCRAEPAACRFIGERVNELIEQAGEIVRLEELKQRCAEAGRELCQDFADFCREHANVCIQPGPPAPINRLDEALERLRDLVDRCDNRDTAACRQISPICAEHPALCPAGEVPAPTRGRPSTDAPSRPGPAITPIGEQRPGR